MQNLIKIKSIFKNKFKNKININIKNNIILINVQNIYLYKIDLKNNNLSKYKYYLNANLKPELSLKWTFNNLVELYNNLKFTLK